MRFIFQDDKLQWFQPKGTKGTMEVLPGVCGKVCQRAALLSCRSIKNSDDRLFSLSGYKSQ